MFYIGPRFGPEMLEKPPFAWWSRVWTQDDEELLGCSVGKADGQARWEAFALLVSFVVWGSLVPTVRGKVAVVGDAEGVLLAYFRFKAADPKINEMMMELAVRLAPTGRDLSVFHVFSEVNKDADRLSRTAAGEPPPSRVLGVPRTRVELGPWQFMCIEMAPRPTRPPDRATEPIGRPT